MKINLFNINLFCIIIFLLIIFIGADYNDNRIKSDDLIVIIVNKEKCNLSRKIEGFIRSKQIRNRLVEQRQQIFKFYAQDHLEYARSLGTEYLPTVYRIRNSGSGWYIHSKLDPNKTRISIKNLLRFLGEPQRIVSPPSGGT